MIDPHEGKWDLSWSYTWDCDELPPEPPRKNRIGEALAVLLIVAWCAVMAYGLWMQ